jgi:hypothetical protein
METEFTAALVMSPCAVVALDTARPAAPLQARAGLSVIERVLLGAAGVSACLTIAFVIALAVLEWLSA